MIVFARQPSGVSVTTAIMLGTKNRRGVSVGSSAW